VLIHVRTRGRPRKQDYQFLGAAPEDFWWRAYRPVTDIERPTILVRSDGTAWQSYISGITSERLDSTEIIIQFNLALAGDCGTGGENALALSVITRAAAGLAQRGGQSIPGDLLDKQLPADEVERMLDAPGTETLERAADAVRAAYAAPPEPPAEPPPAAPAPPAPAAEDPTTEPAVSDRDWIGGLADAAALDAFTALAARLLGGLRGSALALNLVEAPADLAELPAWDGTVGALSVRPGPHLGMAVRNLGKAGAPPAAEEERKPGRHRSPRPVPSRKKTLILAGVAAAVVALAIVIAWLALNW
jgi:hypothetical protein